MIHYLENQPWAIKLTAWDTMEDLQDTYLHYHITWRGFVPAFYERCEDN